MASASGTGAGGGNGNPVELIPGISDLSEGYGKQSKCCILLNAAYTLLSQCPNAAQVFHKYSNRIVIFLTLQCTCMHTAQTLL